MTRLALVMIARDESRSIGRALASCAGVVDQMIVLDTGSVDETRQIAIAHGAQVHEFVWCDDFAAARNAALGHSDADWNLVLDADEWLEGDLTALGPDHLPAGEAFLGQVRIGHHFDQAGEVGVSRSWTTRVLPRGVLYAGRIHEQPVSDLPHRQLDIRVGHDGLLAENRARKVGRNETLLLRDLEAAPQDAYLWLQLAKEYQADERAEDAAGCFASALTLAPPDAPYRHALVVRAITAFKTAGRLDDALALAQQEIDFWEDSPDFFFAVGDLYLELASRNPDRALNDLLPVALFAWKRCLEIGDRDDLDGSVAGRGGYMAAHNLAACYEVLGEKASAAEYAALERSLRTCN